MTLFEDSEIVCVYLYTYSNEAYKNEAIGYTFNSATIIYREKDKDFNNLKKQKIFIETRNDIVTSVRICMRYDIAVQFLNRLGFRVAIGEPLETDEKYIGYNEYWDSIYPSRACSVFPFPQTSENENELEF